MKKYNQDELSIALAFAKEANKEYGDLLKAVVLFGSAARKLSSKTSVDSKDIDILLVIDDIHIAPSKELAEAYKIVTEKLVAKISNRLHITTLKFTTFWDFIRNGDPIAINILRDGVPILDSGFIEPMQVLLLRGLVKPSYESIWTYYNRANNTLLSSKQHLLRATVDLYWSVMDSAEAVLMKYGKIPPNPEIVSRMIDEVLVTKNLCTLTYVEICDFFYKLNKEIENGMVTSIEGCDFDKYYKKASKFVDKMRQIINKV